MKPIPDEDLIPMKQTWDKPFHLERTRTTFLRLDKLHSWDNVHMTLSDGNVPFTMVVTVSLTVNDIDQLMEALKGARKALVVDLARIKAHEEAMKERKAKTK